jgi:sugar phosphate isomerase/epimerase
LIYISTGGFKDLAFDEVVLRLNNYGITAFELSGGRYTEQIKEKLHSLSLSNNLAIHNYFPPHEFPFVFNLASLNAEIVESSISHAKLAIDYAALTGSGVYSFHAGYLIDPRVKELGENINKRLINPRDKCMDLFISRVNKLSEYAESKNVKLMIENNVLSQKNYLEFGDCPLMMVELEETAEIMGKTNENVGLLIDVAHLKVSARTLGFSGQEYLQEFKSLASAYHFSENNGLADDNNPVTEKSWFWPFINKDLDYYSLEIYENDGDLLKSQFDLTKGFLNKC